MSFSVNAIFPEKTHLPKGSEGDTVVRMLTPANAGLFMANVA